MLWIPMVVILAIIIVVFQTKLRKEVPEYGILLSITFLVVVSLSLIPRLGEIMSFISSLALESSIGSMYLAPVLKTIGVAYVTSFGAQISRDCGEDSIGSAVEIAGKVIIIMIALPVMQAILYALWVT